ncbi:hypothetical protein CC78DRAFT_541480 [Lojkania enalia]|uniref:Zn(2)-C6 fungal-type domain-containing protein n=1 Tax=Lojkania enalia TaxID=147567 RepID=A0A9P4KGE5_9PLEO|nr:hypothetical protein CC78DRAFT_541480 [Didymosphaeria enalia]
MTSAASSYPDPESQIGSGGLYVQNGTSPPGQQQQHMANDPELQLQEHLGGQLQRNADILHAGAPQAHQMGLAHHQFQTPPRPAHSPQQMAQSVMNLEEHNPYGDHDGASSRKRSKVSRACDECRRKKIRCDATSENGPEACSSCKRTGARCQFSRQPMKRGPSKGYIKELADRLNSLEHQIQNPNTPGPGYESWGISDQGLPDAQTPSQFARKRTHSMSEGLQDPYSRLNWSGQDRGIDASSPPAVYALTYRDYPSNGAVQGLQRRPSYSDMTLASSLMTGSNDTIIKAYYNTIHPTLPFLAHDPTFLNRLTDCPPKLREAFFLSLEVAVRSLSVTNGPTSDFGAGQLVSRCLNALDETQQTLSDPDSLRQLFNNIVCSQSLVFLILASDKPGPSVMSTAELLGRLAARITELRLNDSRFLATIKEQDHDSFEASRRLYWVSFILDRFHASSRTTDALLPLHGGSPSRDDFNALGEIGFVTRAGNTPNLDPSSPFALVALGMSSPASLYLNGQLSRFKESLDISNLVPSSAPYLAYQYIRIVVARLSEFTSSNEVSNLARELLGNLNNSPITPLHHIFASLVATSLGELADRVETQVEAHAAIKDMCDAISNGRIIYRSVDGTGWDTAIQDLLHQKRTATPPPIASEQQGSATEPNMAGLQHLAAAAVGERESADGPRPNSSGGNGALPPVSDIKHDVTAAIAAASEAAAAQATAAAAQKQLNETRKSSGNGNGTPYDPTTLVKEGFMTGLP